MLSTLSNVAKRHSLLIFFVLACALSWWPRIWYTIDPVNAPGYMLASGPLVAALIMLALTGGKAAVKTFLGRIGHWGAGLRWYVLVLGLPALLTPAAAGVNLLLGANVSATAEFPTWPDLIIRFIVIFLYIGLGEEPAWRGYALPRLLVGRSAVAASVLLGLFHIVWHLPLFGLEYDLHNGVPWALAVIAFSVLMTWLYKHTQGSLLLPALFHTVVGTSTFFFGMFSGGDLLRLWWLWSGLYVVVAVIVVLMTGPNLVRTPVQPEVELEPAVGI